MDAQFYRAFEERHYAPRSIITELRRQYLPFVVPLARNYPGGRSYDIGCGRGEWLELMGELGLQPYGVDLDAGMLQSCTERNLSVHQGDAVAYLETLESESQVVVSAFHVVEHISFEQLQSVVTESLRVLRPGGLLIMETPNPENIGVSTRNFYLDPTHQRPIPDQLLSFLVEYAGFARTKVLRLQENKVLVSSSEVSLMEVLTGVSPDYAVIGQKGGSDGILQSLSEPFSKEYGLSLSVLAKAYDGQRETRIRRVAEQAIQASEAVADTQTEMQSLYTQVAALDHELRVLDHELRAQISVNHGLKAQLEAMLSSRSWKITSPLRKAGDLLRRLPGLRR